MIDLTPLDVRNKRGDFRKALRGYDPEEVDSFLELVAERLEALVKERLTLTERVERLQEQVSQQEGREKAVQDALVTAQALRKDVQEQARKESELLIREAELEVERVVESAERRLEERKNALEEMERLRLRFLRSFRSLLERELDAVEVEEGRKPLEDTPLEIEFTVGQLKERVVDQGIRGEPEPTPDGESSETATPGDEDGPLWLSSVLMEEDGSGAAEEGEDDREAEETGAPDEHEGEKRAEDGW